jgi:hypothetical protein
MDVRGGLALPLRGFGRKVEAELSLVPTTIPDKVVDDRDGCGDESEAVVGADALVLGAFIVAVIKRRDIFRYVPCKCENQKYCP